MDQGEVELLGGQRCGRGPVVTDALEEWDGGGLHAAGDPSTNTPSPCVMLVQIQDGEFVRATPDEGFDRDDEAIATLEGDYATSTG